MVTLRRSAVSVMAWIESHQELLGHPKTRKFARLLEMPRIHAIGHLHALWWWCMDYADDGLLGRFTNDVIADACEWEGDPDVFVNALVSAGFIDQLGAGYEVHHWDDYAGKLIRRRRANTERMRESRAVHKGDTDDAPSSNKDARALHVQRTDDAHTHTCEATVPNPTVPYLTRPDSTEPEKTTAPAREAATAVAVLDSTKPFDVFTEGCALTGTDPAEITGKARTRQLGYISEALKDYTGGDIIGCLGWLMSDDWRRGRGVDYKTVLDNLPKWKLAGKPESVRSASARAPTIDDIKSNALRSILTVDLSDITEEPIRDPRRRVSQPDRTPNGLAPGTGRIDGGERLPAPDVLPLVARPGPDGL